MLVGGEESGVLGVSRIVHRGDSQVGHGLILRGFKRRLARRGARGHPRSTEEEDVYRDDFNLVLKMLAEIREKVDTILRYIEDEEDGDEEEEEDRPDA
ncbi:MAG TPA: hypothetical protein VI409_13410 [Gaiellaceae bacterium]|nr:hypothetical protein [Gaiellaceae bacterium]